MSNIKPFKSIESPQRNKLATRKWTTKFLRMVLGKLNITGQGIAIKQTGDGHLHFEVEGAGSENNCAYPFKIAINVDGYLTVSSGQVRMESASAAIPVIAGVSLDAATPPQLFVGRFTGTRYVVLKVKHEPALGTFRLGAYSVLHINGGRLVETPAITLVATIPANVVALIDWTAGTVTPGERYVTLATLKGNGESVTIEPGWWGHLHVIVTGTGDTQLNIGG